MVDPNALLVEALSSHGLAPRAVGGWLELEGSRAALRARAWPVSEAREGVVFRLDVQVSLPDGRLVTESFGAPGKNADESVKAALGKFVVGSLHPLLGAFFAHREHGEVERWKVGDLEYDVFLGPLIAQSSGKGPAPATPPLAPIVKELLLAGDAPGRRAHWTRSFFAQLDGKPETREALWDGEPWPEMVEALQKVAWPKPAGYLSVRHFLVLAPLVAEESEGPDYRTIERAIDALVETCARDKALNDDLLVDELQAKGVAPELAERVVTFGPLGFSAVLLHGCKLTPDYQLVDAQDRTVSRRFVDEPVFVAAREVAGVLTMDPAKKDSFFAVASRCSRFAAANQALGRGTKLEEIVFEPPIVFERAPRRREESKLPAPDTKPWWKFW